MEMNEYTEGVTSRSNLEPEIPEKEQNEVRRLMDLFYIFKRYRKRYDKNFLDYYKLMRGSQWDSRRPSWKNSEVINMIWKTIQSQVPLQTDIRPRFSFLPTEPSDLEFAQILDEIAESDYERYNWLRVIFEVIFDGWVYGTGISSTTYAQKLDYGLGGVLYKSEDPLHCYPHPDANTINDVESETFIYARPVATDKLKHEFPEKAKYIKKDVTDKLKKERTETTRSTESAYFNSDLDLPMGEEGDSNANLDDVPRTMVYRFYMIPKEVEESEESEIDEETGEEKTSYTVSRKYPKGRYVVIANKQILHDGPLEDDSLMIPFAKYNNYIMPREFWGVSECEQLKSPQSVFNKILCFSLDALAMTGNPIWIVDSNSSVDTDNLNNIPGDVVEKNPGSEVRREAGVGVNPTAFTLLNLLETQFGAVAGTSEFSEGRAEGGVTAASAIEQLISASRTRIRQKQRNVDEYMKDAGLLYMNNVFQNYSVPKIYRLTNKDGSQTFRKFRVENEGGQRVAIFNDYDGNVEKGSELIELPERKLILKGRFDVRVMTGSGLPFDIADNERKALALFDRGIIDEEEVLTRVEYPNREKVLIRLKERQQAQAEAAQQQQQQGG